MAGIVVRIVLPGHKKFFVRKAMAIPTFHQDGIGFPSVVDIVIVPVQFHIACIIQSHPSVLHKGGSGIDAMTVKGLIRHKRCSLKAPVKQITAGAVSPELQSSFHIEGRILIKRVVHPLILA